MISVKEILKDLAIFLGIFKDDALNSFTEIETHKLNENLRRFHIMAFGFIVFLAIILTVEVLVDDIFTPELFPYYLKLDISALVFTVIFSIPIMHAIGKEHSRKKLLSYNYLIIAALTLQLIWAGLVSNLSFVHGEKDVTFYISLLVISFIFYFRIIDYLFILFVSLSMLYLTFTVLPDAESFVRFNAEIIGIIFFSIVLNRFNLRYFYKQSSQKIELLNVNRELQKEIEKRELIEKQLIRTSEELDGLVKQKSNQITRNQEKYQLLFENMTCGYCLIEIKNNDLSQMRIKEYNNKLLDYFSFEPDHLLRLNIQDMNLPFYKKIIQEFQFNKGIGKTSNFIFQDTENDKYFDIYAFNPSDNEVALLINDISLRLKEEEALHRSMERYRAVAETTIAGIIITDSDENLTFVNHAFASLLGYTQQELFGANMKQLTDRSSFELLRRMTAKRKRGEISTYEVPLLRKNGTIQSVLISASPLRHSDGSFAGALGVVVDISELKQKEKELIEAKNKAQEADNLKTSFLANMSHEIRTPMNAIVGFSELLSKSQKDEKKRARYIHLIRMSSKTLLTLINDIIDLARIEAGHVKILKKDFRLGDLIEKIHSQFQQTMSPEKQQEIDFELEATDNIDHLIINSDEERMTQILSNLIGNAIKYTDKGFVKWGYELENDRLLFHVKDSGIGIPEKLKDAVFERFRQGDESFTKQYGGTGLGLAISKRLSKMLNGEIWFTSEERKGSVFYFRLPVEIKELKPVEGVEESIDLRAYKGKKIIIAEDEESNYYFLKEALYDFNFEIFHARNGNEVLQLLKEHPEVNLILMDIQMPEMNGYETTALIKKENPEIKIIAQTAFAMSEDRQTAIDKGCDGYISKPINPDKLIQLIVHLYKINS